MGKKSRAFLFILVNIIVSVSVTLTVLWFWQRAHPLPDISAPSIPATAVDQPSRQSQTGVQDLDPTPDLSLFDQDVNITIRAIVGAGDINIEYVEIINQGKNPTNLTGWQHIDEDGHKFTFPALILNSGGAIKILSKAGTNTVIELFWRADSAIWQSGETARLVDSAGETITTYSIP